MSDAIYILLYKETTSKNDCYKITNSFKKSVIENFSRNRQVGNTPGVHTYIQTHQDQIVEEVQNYICANAEKKIPVTGHSLEVRTQENGTVEVHFHGVNVDYENGKNKIFTWVKDFIDAQWNNGRVDYNTLLSVLGIFFLIIILVYWGRQIWK